MRRPVVLRHDALLMRESDLFEPIKKFFTDDGYCGDGEVEGIDLYLEKDGLTTAVELKKTLDFKSIQQAALDQKICDFVYIGIFRPKDLYSKTGRDKIYLLKRLGIGLICVSARSGHAEVISEPVVSELSAFQKRHKDRAAFVKEEFKNRKARSNTGGVNKTALLTVYKEQSLLLLYHLERLGGESSGKQLRELTGIQKSTSILYDNYNGWFERVSKGIYGISEKGLAVLTAYREEIKKWKPAGTDAVISN